MTTNTESPVIAEHRVDLANAPILQQEQLTDAQGANNNKRPLGGNQEPRAPGTGKKANKKKFKEPPAVDSVSHEGVLIADIRSLLKTKEIAEEAVVNNLREFFLRPRGTEHPEHRVVQVHIEAISGIGEGIGLVEALPVEGAESSETRYQAVIVPFTAVGDIVEAKIYKTQKYFFNADLLKVLTPSPLRDDSLVNCQYFGKCSGCQYQMLKYSDQLEIKRNVIVNAYKHNSNLNPALIPTIGATVASPEQYYYRTKLTPHFDIPRKTPPTAPPVGFGQPGRKTILDIEECAIGTPVINQGLAKQRAWFKDNFTQYKRGATLLLRENTIIETPENIKKEGEDVSTAVATKTKICATSTKDIITEYVGNYVFKYPASSFFQNNNSILVDVTSYVRDNLALPSTGEPPSYVVDTYCGCGLFTITCSGKAKKVIGVEISQDSVKYAKTNAELNGVAAEFIVGQAEKIFDNVQAVPSETSIIIDPPRKGCDELFLNQLLAFLPAKIVYVSCNVHSQARDIGYLLNSERGAKYTIESIKGFDFFPQTHHVESVAVLSLKA